MRPLTNVAAGLSLLDMSQPSLSHTIRTATVADAVPLAELHIACWRETYPGLMPEAVLNRLSLPDRTQRWQAILGHPDVYNGAVVLLIECERRLVGFGSYGDQRASDLLAKGFTGEITALYLLRAAQKQGLGRALMATLARGLIARGHRAANLWVLRENVQARGFYERLGGEVVGEKEDERDGAVLIELAYGWRNLLALSLSNQSAMR